MRTTTTARRALAATATVGLIASAGLGLMAGCNQYKPGGTQISGGPTTYPSTTFTPQNVRIVDLRDGQVLWRVAVPVDQQLVIRFYEGTNRDSRPDFPDEMRWEVMPLGQLGGPLTNSIAMPPYHALRIETELRDAPDWVEGFEPIVSDPSLLTDGDDAASG